MDAVIPARLAQHWRETQQTLCRCVIALTWSDQLIEPREGETKFERYDVQPRVASGCFVEVRGAHFFFTAGHVLEGIERAPQVGRRTFKFGIMDGFHRDGHRTTRIPFPYETQVRGSIDHDIGLDYGLVHIPDLIADNIKRGGGEALSEPCIASIDETFDFYGLIGLPSQEFTTKATDSRHERHTTIRMGLPMLPVDALVPVPPQYQKDGNPFVGRILSLSGRYQDGTEAVLENIEGMSGGPVFGFRVADDSIHAKLVAIQSRWWPLSRVISASRAAYYLDAVGRHADAVLNP